MVALILCTQATTMHSDKLKSVVVVMLLMVIVILMAIVIQMLGDILVAGVHSDAEITRVKGPPVMNNEER